MKNNITISIINSLEKSEISAFRKFIISPFFSRREDYLILFNNVIHQLESKKGLDKLKLFLKTYPNLSYDDVKLRASLSDLKEQLEKFLSIQHLLKNDIKKDISLLEIFGSRKLIKPFNQKLKKLDTEIAKSKSQDLSFFQNRLGLLKLKTEDLARQKRTADLPLQNLSNQIEANFILEKLKLTCTQLTHQRVYKTQYDFGLLDDVILHLKNGNFIDIPAIAIRYYCFLFLSSPSKKIYFDQFRDLLFEHEKSFDIKELKDLYLLGLNFCIRQLNQGNELFPPEIWLLYEKGLKAGVFLEDGRLSRFTFNNIVGIGINLKKSEWLQKFIETYKKYLIEEDKDAIIYFNQARIIHQFENAPYQVIELLHKVNSKDIVENLMAKNLLSKVYFELGEFELLDYHLTNFKQYIRRQKVGKYHKDNYNNIISLIKSLLTLSDYDKDRRIKLREKIKTTKILTEREWLLKQL